MPEATEDLVERLAATTLETTPPDVREIARACVLDCLGVALAGSQAPLTRIVCATLADAGDRQTPASRGNGSRAAIIGRRLHLNQVDAAIVNGTACHALDYDDTQLDMEGHASAPVLPALLALGEARNSSGAAVLAAFIAGVECECQLGSVVNPGHYDGGWHASATLGRFGAAGACAHLCRLEASAMTHALDLAGLQAAGLKWAFGSMAKPFQVGKAAGDGLLSALLAERGLKANTGIVESPGGFAQMYAGAPAADSRAGATDPYFLRSVLFKFHAACHLAHPAINVAEDLRREHDLSADDVRSVQLDLTEPVRNGCGVALPQTGLEAKFSARAGAAFALLGDDTGDPSTFSDSRVQEADFLSMLSRIEISEVEEDSSWATTAHVTTKDGRVLVGRADIAGSARDLDSQAIRLQEKFFTLAEPVIGEHRAQALEQRVQGLESLESVRELTSLCSPPRR